MGFALPCIQVHVVEVRKMVELSINEMILPSNTSKYTKNGSGSKWYASGKDKVLQVSDQQSNCLSF